MEIASATLSGYPRSDSAGCALPGAEGLHFVVSSRWDKRCLGTQLPAISILGGWEVMLHTSVGRKVERVDLG
jgi:hypothetical protein